MPSQSAVAAGQAGVQAAREQLIAGQTQTDDTSPQEHPNVQRAAAKLREAWLALERGGHRRARWQDGVLSWHVP